MESTGIYQSAQKFCHTLPAPLRIVGKTVVNVVNVFTFRARQKDERKISYIVLEVFASLAKVAMAVAGLLCVATAIKSAAIPFFVLAASYGVFQIVRHKIEIKEPSELVSVSTTKVQSEQVSLLEQEI